MDLETGLPYRDEKKISIIFKIKCLYHLIVVVHHSFVTIYSMCTFISLFYHENQFIRIMGQYGMCLGTTWNFAFQTIFIVLALSGDIAEWFQKTNSVLYKKLIYWRDVIFTGLVVPLSMFVTSMFWCIYWIDRELVFPKVFDTVIPWWFNHCVHTNVMVVVLIEMTLHPRKRPVDQKTETILYCGVAILYAIVYYSIYFIKGIWLYQVFGIMTWWQVCLFQIVIWFSTHFYYRIQFPLSRLIHSCSDRDNLDSKDIRKEESANSNKEHSVKECRDKKSVAFDCDGSIQKNGEIVINNNASKDFSKMDFKQSFSVDTQKNFETSKL